MNNNEITLGVMPPLTGLVSIYGEEISRAAKIACAEINENGGVLGRSLKLVIEDDGSLPESAVAAAEKLVDRHRCVAIIGNLLSNSRIAVAYRVAEPRKIPYLNFSFYEGSILSRYFFHFAALPNQQIDRMIPYMQQKFGPRMFFAGNNYEWPRGSIHAAKLALEGAGGTVVGEEYCPIGVDAETIEQLLDHIEAAAPDVFVPYFAGIDQVNLLTRFTRRGMKQRIAVVMGHYDEIMASTLSAEVRKGFYSSNTYFMSIDTEENRNYLSRLAQLPGVEGVWPQGNGILTNFGEGTHICVKAFAQAANLAGSVDPEALVQALESVSIAAPQGLVQMNAEHHHAKVNTYLTHCEADGRFTIVENFGGIEPALPERYKHQQVNQRATLEEDIRLQARMLEQLSEGVFLTSTQDTTILYANAGAERLFGYSREEMIGMFMARLCDPDASNPNEVVAGIIQTINQRGEWQGEILNISKDDLRFWSYVTASTFTHPVYGEVCLLVQRDITERKRIENDLRENEELLSTSQKMAHIGSWKLDLTNNRLYWSDEVFRIFGCEPLEFPSTYEAFLEFVHPNDRTLVNKAYTESLENDANAYQVEHRVVQKNSGRIRFVYERCLHKRNTQGQVIESIGYIQDITERKQAEVAQRESEEQFRTLFEHASDGIFLMNEIGIVDCNTQGAAMFNLSKDSIIGSTPIELSPIRQPDGRLSAESAQEKIQAAMTGKTQRFEWQSKRSDGSLFDLELTLNRVEIGGKALLLVITRDITDRKKNEVELAAYRAGLEHVVQERTQELNEAKLAAESATLAKSAFLANMSHEIRTPMNAVIGYAEVLKAKSDNLTEAQKEKLDKIGIASEHLLSIVNDVLDISKIEARKLKLERVEFDCGDILDKVSMMIVNRARSKGLNYVVEKDYVSQSFIGDPTRLSQMLLNYLSNAIKFTENGNIALRKKKVEETGHDMLVRFEVEDTGKGISAEEQSRLFTAFEQADNSITRKHGGTGLGLAITKHLAELMDGEVGVTSTPGQGSTFWFTARLSKAQAQAPAPAFDVVEAPSTEMLLKQNHAGKRLLIAEDNEFNRDLVTVMLSETGLVLDFAEDGKLAVEKAQSDSYHLILMDMQMPEMSGIDATKAIRQLPAYVAIPIIAMTGNAFAEDRKACLDAGMNDHLAKPVKMEDLSRTLLQWLEGKSRS